jgi:CopA family copper-resistance protein
VTDDITSALRTAVTRRDFIRAAGAAGLITGLDALRPTYAWSASTARATQAIAGGGSLQPRMAGGDAIYDLTIDRSRLAIAGRGASTITVNGTVPGPLLHLYEGQNAVIRVHNRLDEDTSIHWHGLLVPMAMDGVPGVSFPGIRAGTTFEYRFPVRQSGTYWYHSHSGMQEQSGHYGPMIVHPTGGYPYQFDREYVIVLSDWTFEDPYRVLDHLKKQGSYYNYQRRTVVDFFRDIGRDGFMPTVRERLMWLQMRMDPTDILDVTASTYTYLMNGMAPGSNWTGIFKPGERVLLRFINAAADTTFDVRLPGLPMRVVQASGQLVQPVETDEFRIANAETYDVIVTPDGRPYTIFAETTDRSGYAKGTLTMQAGFNAPTPERRQRPLLVMGDMGMSMAGMSGMGGVAGMKTGGTSDTSGMSGKDMSGGRTAPAATMPGMDMPSPKPVDAPMPAMAPPAGDRAKYAVAGISRTSGLRPPGTLPGMIEHEPGTHGPENSAVPMMVGPRLAEPGSGLGEDGWRVLVYADLKAIAPRPDFRAPDREIELHLTGNMERYMWSINGQPFSQDLPPIRMNYGERVRLTMVNDSMMNHPMHLHGMFMELENGHGELIPRVHTVNVKPAERLSLLISADAPGRWAFHCHILYHMETGMFRVVEVSQPGHHFSAAELADVR